jgi:hypothetical protein
MSDLKLNQPLFHFNLQYNKQLHFLINKLDLYRRASPGGKFHLNVATKFKYNRLSPRDGQWSTPFPYEVMPAFKMPSYDSSFNKSFEEVSDSRALDVRKIMEDNPEKRIALYYSGGIDSTISLVSLLKVLTRKELEKISIGMSFHSVSESPLFFQKYILNKFPIIDLTYGRERYSSLFDKDYYIITADNGDSMFGTELGTQFYYEYQRIAKNLNSDSITKLDNLMLDIANPEVHYSNFADILIQYFDIDYQPNFGKRYYEKIVNNINTSSVPVHTLHDFFWWFIFNIKWMHCSLRGPMMFGESTNFEEPVNKLIINWFNSDDYQRWSMVNNNNGQKIMGTTAATYKWAGRKYIYDFTKDDWYFNFKLKLASLNKITKVEDKEIRNSKRSRFGIDNNYNLLLYNDDNVRKYITHHMENCSNDW